MIAFLRWARSIAVGTFNGIVKFAFFVILLFFALFLIGLAEGDGLPSNIVLAMDLRGPIADSSPYDFTIGARPVTVMDIVLGLDAAARDGRVKGVIVRLGDANISIPKAEEIGAAFKRFRQSGKFVIAHAQAFDAPGLGDYLTAAATNQIWMQPKSPFGPSGEGGGEIFLRGLFDKIQAEPQIAKRSDYKSAADMYMEKNMTPADREQVTALMQSWYNSATEGAAGDRKLNAKTLAAVFEKSPQFAEDARAAGLIDRIGYDDDAQAAAYGRAGHGAKFVKISEYVRATEEASQYNRGTHIALIEGSGEIVEGTAGGGLFSGNAVMASDDIARAIREASRDRTVKGIIFRVDSPGGSVTASDQILDAVKKAQAKGIPVVVSMGSLAASGGYYVSASADKIVAEPGTITGSIGVLTGKVSFGKSAGLLGVNVDQVGIGKNALIDSDVTPFTPDQWAALNAQADSIYADFKQKVATGRKLPLDKVQEIARGRVWSGADAKPRGLVDDLGGFWTAASDMEKLAKMGPDEHIVFKRFPRSKTFFQALNEMLSQSTATAKAMQGLVTLMNTPMARALVSASEDLPRGGVELRATNLPH